MPEDLAAVRGIGRWRPGQSTSIHRIGARQRRRATPAAMLMLHRCLGPFSVRLEPLIRFGRDGFPMQSRTSECDGGLRYELERQA
jgi:hypothetical protein